MSNEPDPNQRRATFRFTDGTHLTLEWAKAVADDSRELVQVLREALSAEQFAAEVDGRLVVIQMKNVKYIEISPVPGRLPSEWLRGARQVDTLT